jgi:hypothetical protein
MQSHVPGQQRPFKCDFCPKRFTRLNDRKRHEAEVHGKNKFECEGTLPTGERWGCGKQFSRLNTLKQHQKECTDFQKPKRSSQKSQNHLNWSLAGDLEVQKRARNLIPINEWKHEEHHFVCKLCEARRHKKLGPSFVEHLVGHLEDLQYRAYECKTCHINFVLPAHLNAHKTVCGQNRCVMRIGGASSAEFWGCDKKFDSEEEFDLHWTGDNGYECRARERELELRLRSSIVEQLAQLKVKVKPMSCSSFIDYIKEIRKEALSWSEA